MRYVIKKRKPDICLLNETHVTHESDISNLKLGNYDFVHCKSYSKHTGGVSVYVNRSIKYRNAAVFEYNNAWFVSLEININNLSTIFAGVYLKCDNKTNVMESFNQWFEQIPNDKQIVISGDFNIDMLVNTPYSRQIECLCLDNGLTQLVDRPTRIDQDSATLIDLCITNIDRKKI